MARLCERLAVYVAFHFFLPVSLGVATVTPGGGGSANPLSLLQPYDFLYYSGVRSYFNEEWTKAAEFLEKSIVTKESLLRVRRQCYHDCLEAGKDALSKLGML